MYSTRTGFLKRQSLKKVDTLETKYYNNLVRDFHTLANITLKYMNKHGKNYGLFLDNKSYEKDLESFFKDSGLHRKLLKEAEYQPEYGDEIIKTGFKLGAKDGCKTLNEGYKLTKGFMKTISKLQNENMELITNAKKETINSIKKTILETVTKGEGHTVTTKRLKKLDLEPAGRLTPLTRAKVISRTETNRAFNRGNLDAYKEFGVKYVDLVTAGDAAVCSDCMEMESSNPHPLGKVSAVQHPNCRCALAPHVEGIIELNKYI